MDVKKENCKFAWERVALTNSQMNVYLDQVTNAKSSAYNTLTTLRADSSHSYEQVLEAINKIISAHPILSACIEQTENQAFLKKGNEPLIIRVDEPSQVNLHVDMDLYKGPLTYFYVFKKDNAYYVASVIHHIIFDGRSGRLLEEDFNKVINGEELTQDIEFLKAAEAEKPRQTEEYQNECFKIFDSIFKSVDEISTPFKVDDGKTGCIEINIPLSPLNVENFIKEHQIKESVFFQSVFALVYSAFTGDDKAVFSITDNGRHGLASFNSYGMYVRNIPLCINVNDTTVDEFLKSSSNNISNARKMSDVPFYMLRKRYGVDGSIIFNYMANFAGSEVSAVDVGLFTGDALGSVSGQDSISDLDCYLYKMENSYRLKVLHSDKYSDAYANSIAETFKFVCAQLLTVKNIKDLEYASEETLNFIDQFNKTDKKLRFEDVISALTYFAKETPNSICLRHKDKSFSYFQVDEITNKIALSLIELGAKENDKIAIHVPVSEWYLLCSLAILKLGAIYVPLNTKHPLVYKQKMADRVGVKFILAINDTIETSNLNGIKLLNVEDVISHKDLGRSTFEYPIYKKSDTATILFTSATTGEPKAVALTRGGYANLCTWISDYMGLKQNEAFGMYQTFTFCSHIDPMFGPLFVGAIVDIIPDEIRYDLEELNKYLGECFLKKYRKMEIVI